MAGRDAQPLVGKTAWVSGASRGIGRAVAHALAAAGAHVVGGARRAEHLDTMASVIRQDGGRADGIALDVASWESCQVFAARALDLAGPPSILVNAAGIGIFRPIDTLSPEEFEAQFRVNVFGTFYLCKLAVPPMKDLGGGTIVNVSSLAGESQERMGSGYFASKHAVHGFTKSLALDVRDAGIRVTLLCPGSVDTRFHVDSHPGSHAKDQAWMVTPQQVAESVLFACTVTGAAWVSKLDVRPLSVPRN